MRSGPDASTIASLISDPSRAAILTVLMDGRSHPAGDLAYAANIKPQTASFHLAKMLEVNVVSLEKQGRHRYYRIENIEIAKALETLLAISPQPKVKSFKQVTENENLRFARTCYDHLAGKLGVKLMDALVDKGYIIEESNEILITKEGEIFLELFDIPLDIVRKKRRSFVHKCLDWSERRHHLAGALGHELFERFFELQWIERMEKTRAIRITSAGRKGLNELLSITL
ncbi:winged helix-turn-helix domain-containing protein [Aeromicrobium ponti]|uniref:ArsR family transcriptional regulator n=1 Tax=Cytobacillus oceanisediminis TaxID=665099 RepID=A0A562K6D8_9BACI|nr:winged helix-turn-helix domain-containing protein [Cytobacillus oceanisediminis]TWH90989.1 ArsR family transcriptional regulator [Cytobacillus oceanisediminis]